MAHYDCKNCGEAYGIDFGFCKKCTPEEYFDLQKRANMIRHEVERRLREKMEEKLKEKLGKMKEYQALMKRIKEMEDKH